MTSSVRFLLLAAFLVFSAGCEQKKEEPEPTDQNPDDDPDDQDPDEPDPDDIDLPGDDIKPADILTSEIYKNLVVEITGSVSNIAINNLQIFLQQRIQKSKVIMRRVAGLPSIGKDSVTLYQLKEYEKAHRKKSVIGDTVFVWVESVNARSKDASKSGFRLGHAYGRSSIAMFGKTFNDLTLPDNITRYTLETYTLQHEFCHLFGLVNGGISMKTPHEDQAHKTHCTNTQCLMYHVAGDNIILVDLLGGQNQGSADVVPILDANCISDLQAAGGK